MGNHDQPWKHGFHYSWSDTIDFEINLVFLIEPFFYFDKNLNIFRTKRAFKVK